MGKREITRRQVLAGVAGVGSAGTALGTGTGAILSDEEAFAGSTFTSGTVELSVEWEYDGDDGSSDDGELSVPLAFEKEPVSDPDNFSHWKDLFDDWKDEFEEWEDDHDDWGDLPDDWEDEFEDWGEEFEDWDEADRGGFESYAEWKDEYHDWEHDDEEWQEFSGHWKDEFEDWKHYDGHSGTGGGEYEPETFAVTLSVPEEDGDNPAYVWVGAECPDGDARYDVTIKDADCTEECELFHGSLAELAGGVPIDPDGGGEVLAGDQGCLEPGEDEVELKIEVDPGDVHGKPETDFDLEFEARQCRNTSGETNPFQGDSNCGDDEDPDPKHAISFVAFCSSQEGSIEPKLNVTSWDDDQPAIIEWSTSIDVEFVVVKAGNWYTIYSLPEGSQQHGSAYHGDPTAAKSKVPHSPGNGNGKGRFDKEDEVELDFNPAAEPCKLATKLLDWDGEIESSDKREWEDGDWEEDD